MLDRSRPALGTREQIAAEELILRLLQDPVILEAQRNLRSDVQGLLSAHMQAAELRLPNAIEKWTAGILLREIAADPARFGFLWIYDETPHTWMGLTFPGSGCCGGNPDQIYRMAFLDGAGMYEITGHLEIPSPVQLSFEAFHGQPGTKDDRPRKGPDVGRQISLLRDGDLKPTAPGEFRIQVGGAAPADGTPFMRLEPGSVELTVREVLSDWNQRPAHLHIRRTDTAPVAAPLPDAEIARRAAADLSGFVTFWVGAFDRWVGDAPVNSIVGPVPRDGGWGFLADVHYKLAADQAIIATLDRAGAVYVGLHITDPWTLVPDNRCSQPSLNPAQASANADGSITYIIAATDPGVTNWIDITGLPEGYVILRWIGTPPGTAVESLIGRFDVVDLATARRMAAGAPTQPHDRAARLASRAADHAKRYR